eukprot:Hpha_TRINITY_DN28149_c0_g1::TRINITY_DN28149_c0_g1_i1::g.103325::m.103325
MSAVGSRRSRRSSVVAPERNYVRSDALSSTVSPSFCHTDGGKATQIAKRGEEDWIDPSSQGSSCSQDVGTDDFTSTNARLSTPPTTDSAADGVGSESSQATPHEVAPPKKSRKRSRASAVSSSASTASSAPSSKSGDGKPGCFKKAWRSVKRLICCCCKTDEEDDDEGGEEPTTDPFGGALAWHGASGLRSPSAPQRSPAKFSSLGGSPRRFSPVPRPL